MKPIDIPVAELRKNFAASLARVQAGATLRVTSRGRVIARIEPVLDERQAAERLMAEIRKTAWVGDVITPVEADWGTPPLISPRRQARSATARRNGR